MGYRIDPAFLRQGHASRNLLSQNGFHEVGEQWDEEDGLETIFEVSASRSAEAASD